MHCVSRASSDAFLAAHRGSPPAAPVSPVSARAGLERSRPLLHRHRAVSRPARDDPAGASVPLRAAHVVLAPDRVVLGAAAATLACAHVALAGDDATLGRAGAGLAPAHVH
jgi:hypothetical protein